ncbi:MAG: hypothetical protein ACAI34_14720, partial [Verrucomicrobium sp.]
MRLSVPLLVRAILITGTALVLIQCGSSKATTKRRGGETRVIRAEPVSTTPLYPTPAALNVPVEAAGINDTARFLAGMPAISGRDTFGSLRETAAWKNHSLRMNSLWRDFEWRHGRPVSQWAHSEISDLQKSPAVFYPFSGPDFLFANVFFPYSETYLLCGLEPCDPLPDMRSLTEADIDNGLDALWSSLDTVLQFSYFITKEMRQDFQSSRFRGVLPVFLVFMARTGHVVESIDAVRLDDNGNPQVFAATQNTVPGLLIRLTGPQGPKRVFYFTQNLSNDACKANGAFLRFSTSLGQPVALAKSASYLMHESYFSNVRNHILVQCRGLVQDPSGVPYRNLVER